jgi:hypothetical protein
MWHASLVVHVTRLLPMQAPAWHVSDWVHAFPSLQAVPSAAGGFEHVPLVGSQLPGTWQASLAVQVTGFDPVHAPLTHA